MPSLRDIRRRIASVKNTQQITNAMKMVSAAKLQRAQERVLAARPYAERMQQVIERLNARVRPTAHPLLTPRTEGKTLLVLVTSDRGLCGGFNANVQRAAIEQLHALGGIEHVDLIAIGKKGRDFLTYRHYPLRQALVERFVRQVLYPQAQEVAHELLAAYEQEGYRQVRVVYNSFRSALRQQVSVLRLLPLSPHTSPDVEPPEPFDYLYEPSAPAVLDALLRKEVEVRVFQVLLESFAGEHAARMTAMDSATENAAEMIANLTLLLNRTRQAAITKEIIEVVSGAEALKG
ncbi:MAG: ATP synthase gamma chain [Candidatus Tectimicrobiota bacterium]|nr:MAG: ATP synthase gamma chain [Candidatus Tectomicrobia bacterium]